MKITKKIASVMLCVAMIMSIGSVAMASNADVSALTGVSDFNTITNVVDDYGNVILDISEQNGRFYYFTQTDDYVLTMDINPEEGVVNVYRNDKTAGILSSDSMSLDGLILASNARAGVDVFNVFDETKSLLEKGTLPLSNSYQIIESESQNAPMLMQPSTHPVATHPFTASALAAYGHYARSATFYASTYQSGYSAILYDGTEFRPLSQLTPIRLLASFTINAIAAAISTTVPVAAVLFRTVGQGILGTTYDVDRWRVSVDDIRTTYVSGFPLVNAERYNTYELKFGMDSAVASHTMGPDYWPFPMPGEPSNPHYFHNLTWMMQKAIDEAILNGI